MILEDRKIFYKLKFIIEAVFIFLLFTSCDFGLHELFYRQYPVEERTKELKLLSGEQISKIPQSDNFSFVVFTDIHYGHKTFVQPEARFLEWLDSVKSDKPVFCVNLGDTADTGAREQFEKFVEFENKIKDRGLEVYSVPGNHDLYNSGYLNFKELLNPYSSFYKFETEKFSFYFVDTASGVFGDLQLELLKKSFASDNKQKILFSHFPINGEGSFYFRLQNTDERNKVMALLAENNVKVFTSGHAHGNYSKDFHAFYDLNFYSFGKSHKWILFHVDQTAEKISWEFVK